MIDLYQACFLTFFAYIDMKKKRVDAFPFVILFCCSGCARTIHRNQRMRAWCGRSDALIAIVAELRQASVLRFDFIKNDEKWGVYAKNALFSAENKDVLKYWGGVYLRRFCLLQRATGANLSCQHLVQPQPDIADFFGAN